jgi:archaellum component FlaD/FlaE
VSTDLDPTAYDVDELRRAARGLGTRPERRAETEGMSPSVPARAAAAEELLLAAAEGRARRPYLPALPAGFAAETTAEEFCSFLLERAGFARAYRTLAHYDETGWLGRSAREALETRLTGLADGTDPRPAGGRLTPEDHRVSLVYVARLATVGGGGDAGPSPDLRSDGGVDACGHVDAATLAEWFGDRASDLAGPQLADDSPSHQSRQ